MAPRLVRSWRRSAAIPYHGVSELKRPVLRTRLLRAVLAVLLVAVLACAVITAATASHRSRSQLAPSGRPTVVVVDVSKSIIDRELARVRATLRTLVRANTPTGLVVFSDVAYELLPPDAPATALVPILRYFTPVHGVYPRNPWQPTFRAGTQISASLDLAERILARRTGAPYGSILLISDLETASSDVEPLTKTLTRLHQEGVAVRVVPMVASDRSRKLFRDLLGPSYLLPVPRDVAPRGDATTTLVGEFPVALLVLAAAILLGIAANERWCTRLDLGLSRRGEAT